MPPCIPGLWTLVRALKLPHFPKRALPRFADVQFRSRPPWSSERPTRSSPQWASTWRTYVGKGQAVAESRAAHVPLQASVGACSSAFDEAFDRQSHDLCMFCGLVLLPPCPPFAPCVGTALLLCFHCARCSRCFAWGVACWSRHHPPRWILLRRCAIVRRSAGERGRPPLHRDLARFVSRCQI